jgi:hypothetical protein
MRGPAAGLVFLGICIVLAVLLFAHVIKPAVSGIIFAVALVVLGGWSRGLGGGRGGRN